MMLSKLFSDFRVVLATISFLLFFALLKSTFIMVVPTALMSAFITYFIVFIGIGVHRKFIERKRNESAVFDVFINQVNVGSVPGKTINRIQKEAYSNGQNWTALLGEVTKSIGRAILWDLLLTPVIVFWIAFVFCIAPQTLDHLPPIFTQLTQHPKIAFEMAVFTTAELMVIFQLIISACGGARFGYRSPFKAEISERLRHSVVSPVIGEVTYSRQEKSSVRP